MKIVWTLLILVVTNAGCATTKKYEAVLSSWVGSNINSLIDKWGYPSNSFKIPNGNTVYVYENHQNVPMPMNTYYNSYTNMATTYGGGYVEYWCKTYFEVNENNVIVKWRWEGNNCVSE